MDNLLKKKLIACLLALSCVICVVSLASQETAIQSVNPEKADSLLFGELSAFNIPSDMIGSERVEVDSTFHRINYRVRLPAGVSKTWFHSELSRKLYPHNLTTWANVDFPDQHMDIHILSNHTILRSISVVTDTSYQRLIYPAVVMFYFDQLPPPALLNRIGSFGEPIALVLRVQNSVQAGTWSEKLDPLDHLYYFWMTDDNQFAGSDFNESQFLSHSRSLADISSGPALLFFQPVSDLPDQSFFEKLADRDISLIQTRDASIIPRGSGKFEFNQEFRNFSNRARQGQHPIILIHASDESLEWFSNGLNELKKGGIRLLTPATLHGR
ncbi:MAG: hypothetical protein WD266_06005 [Balneolales bacterium]